VQKAVSGRGKSRIRLLSYAYGQFQVKGVVLLSILDFWIEIEYRIRFIFCFYFNMTLNRRMEG
jgi:hypothetical protein